MSDPVLVPLVADTWTLVASAIMSAQVYPRAIAPGPAPALFRYTYRDTGNPAPVNDVGVVVGLGARDGSAPNVLAEFGEPVDLYIMAVSASSGACVAECEVHGPMASATPIDRLIVARCVALNMKTDEQDKAGTLNGVVAKHFTPTHVVARVTATSGALNSDGTFNVGTAADGATILAAATTTGLTAVGATRQYPIPTATALTILGNATLHANVENAETGAGSLELEIEIIGPQL